MTVRDIVLHAKNETALRKKSEPVRVVNRRTKKIIKDLKETLAAHSDGIGLAAPQINIHQRVVIVRLSNKDEEDAPPEPPLALINPEIIEAKNDQVDFDGCLSFPGLFAQTTRPHYLRIKGLDEHGKPFDRVFEDFDAVLVHHELDHLDGILFIDRVKDINDLYRIREDEEGNLVRVPVVEIEGTNGA